MVVGRQINTNIGQVKDSTSPSLKNPESMNTQLFFISEVKMPPTSLKKVSVCALEALSFYITLVYSEY